MLSENQLQFPGFPPKRASGNFWCYPNVVCLHWHNLLGSEQKTLDCLLRHTWGFDENTNLISLSQLEKGVGRIHNGTGLSRKQIIRALHSLEEKGFIKSDKSGRINRYSLIIEDHHELGTKVNTSGIPMSPMTGDESTLDSDKRIHTIKNSSIEETIKKIYDFYLLKIFPGSREVSRDEIPKLTKKAESKITARLKDFNPESIRKAIINFSESEWEMRNNGTRGIAWFFESNDRLEQFLNLGKLDDFLTRNY